MSQATTFGHPLASGGTITPEDVAAQVDDSLSAILSSHSGASRPSYAVAGMIYQSETSDHWFGYDGTGDKQIVILETSVPATAGATGTAGQWAADADYIYVCTATDTWKRAALSTWA